MFQVGQNTKGFHILGRQQVQTSTGKHTQGSDAGRRRVVRPGATEVQGLGLGFRLVGKGLRGSDVWKRGLRGLLGFTFTAQVLITFFFLVGHCRGSGFRLEGKGDSEAARSSPSVLKSALRC